MQKPLFRDILTTIILIITGSDLIISFPTNELAAFLGAFYLFFSLQIAIASGKQVMALADENRGQMQSYEAPAQINIRTKLAREKYLFHLHAIQQNRRATRIMRLEAELCEKEPQPYRTPPCRQVPWT